MNTYADRLQAEFDEITTGITTVLERAADAGRDLTDEEQEQITRDDARRDTLQKAIGHYTEIEDRTAKVAALRSRVPRPTRVAQQERSPDDPEAELLRMFPTPGHYAITMHRATAKRDKVAAGLIERSQEILQEIARATAHQLTTDNPGLIPNPIVGPVISRLIERRPFIQSIGTGVPPSQKFDRPKVTQDVEVGKQATEKTETASQKMTTVPVPVTLETWAGHLNISLQDIRWSQPGILSLVYESFAKVYAKRTDKAACTDFAAAITQTQPVATLDAAGIGAALGAAAATIGGADDDKGEPDTIWMSRDLASRIGNLRAVNSSEKLYDIPVIGGTTGSLEGLRVVIDGRFAANTAIVGDSNLVEFWEQLEGFLSVDEPNVLGQLVGYAGYTDTVVLDPTGFVKLTPIPAP